MVLSFFKKPEKMPERTAVRPDGVRVQATLKEDEKPHAPSDASKKAAAEDFDISTFYAGGSYGIEVQEETDVYLEMAEHAAMSYATGQNDVARNSLQSLVKGNSDPAALKLWAMLFDLLRLTGDRDAFNTLGLEFARTCELSPPSWGMGAEDASEEKAAAADSEDLILQGALVGDSPIFNDLLQAMSQGKTRSLNFGRLAGLDNEAAAKLAKLLNQVRRRNLAWELEGAEGLAARLVKRTNAGQRQNEPLWLLLLEIYLYLGKEAEFEEKALDYAITFEVSPPTWDRPKTSGAPKTKAAKPVKPPPTLQGELLEGKIDAVKALLNPKAECTLDFSRITRVDLPSATALGQAFQTSGCNSVTLYHPNRMVAEILRIAGVDRLARIELSKS